MATMSNAHNDNKVALIAGVTSLVGLELLHRLLANNEFKLIYGLARRPPAIKLDSEFHFISCNLLDHSETIAKLSPLANQVTHIFWMPRPNQTSVIQTTQSSQQSSTMLSNALDALLIPNTALKHIALQTGTSHYVSFSTVTAPGSVVDCDEDVSRPVGGMAFDYYAMEDVMDERISAFSSVSSISWAVHRPGLLLGISDRGGLNIVGALSVYGIICKTLGLPFLFMGARDCWEEPYINVSDVRLVVDQQIWWASQTSNATNFEAFNAVSGVNFTWKEVWGLLANKLGVSLPDEPVAEKMRYSKEMGDKGKVWDEIVEKNGLRKTKMEDLANWKFVDGLFRCPFKMLASPAKAQKMGFEAVYLIPECLEHWVDRMRDDKLIP